MQKNAPKIKEKILAIVYRKKDGIEFLTMRNNPEDPIHGGDYYYVITGGMEGKETPIGAAKREISEETGIKNIIKITDAKNTFEYQDPAEDNFLCREYCFLVEVGDDVKHLSIEHIGYKWLRKNDFIKILHWYYNKSVLENMLSLIE